MRRNVGQAPRATVREVKPSRPGSQVPRSPKPPGTLSRLLGSERLSFGFAFEGLNHAWRTQRHLRIHTGVAILAAGAGLLLTISAVEWAILLAMVVLVFSLELLNTVVEVVVDMVQPAHHPSAKAAKDMAAAAVLVAAIGAVLVAAAILLPHLLAR